ncbi:TPA: HAD family hydrolase [Streptococcus suis]|uniref:HAD family hydrolase n=1 Tax=Streptococcus suis TaxID=1307 RepID=UPI002AA3CF08|nr:HAD family hydrolase [Streptococcus suis]HEM3603925.1 HAD family hydrolase [Streptococcus suis]HEM3605625.1 HAD family hydrolase [Streptococcus suis]
MIEWIFFDLGSTLLDEEAAYGYYIDKCVKKLESLDIEVSSDSYKKKMVEYAHKSLDPIRATWQYFAPIEPRPLWTNEGVSLYPETIDVLEKLSQNYRLGVIANQSSSIRELLKEWGIESHFQLIILSEEVGLSKPDTTIFTLALQKANIPADRVVYVGDRYDNDILPAKSLGMWTVRILTGFGKYASENEKLKSDWVIPSLQEITNIFEQTKKLD